MAKGGKSKKKPPVWCSCERPVFLLGNDGLPFSAEPICQECRHPRKRQLPTRPIQATHPGGAWAGPGPCPRPPEVETDAYRRGLALASDPEAQRQLVRSAAPSPSSALAKPCPDAAAARALLRQIRGL